jgi:uncharacterized integral membrane protein
MVWILACAGMSGSWNDGCRNKAENEMLRKILTAIVVLPLAAVLIAFAVANRQTVTVSFDPFSAVSPAYATTLPLFAMLFAVLILGVLIGGIAAWFGQGRWRRIARKLDADVRLMQQDLAALRHRAATDEAPRTAEPPPLAAIAPPAA